MGVFIMGPFEIRLTESPQIRASTWIFGMYKSCHSYASSDPELSLSIASWYLPSIASIMTHAWLIGFCSSSPIVEGIRSRKLRACRV